MIRKENNFAYIDGANLHKDIVGFGWALINFTDSKRKSPKNCFRRAADYRLIENVKLWFDFLEARNLVAHTYNEKMADRIYRITKPFLKSAQKLSKK